MFRGEEHFAPGEHPTPAPIEAVARPEVVASGREEVQAFLGTLKAELDTVAKARYEYNTNNGSQKAVMVADEAFNERLDAAVNALPNEQLGGLVKGMRALVREHMDTRVPGESTLDLERVEAEDSALSTLERAWQQRLRS